MAMLTPAQKPRGLARMIFTYNLRWGMCVILASAASKRANANQKRTTPPEGVALRVSPAASATVYLSNFDLGVGDPLLAVLLGDRAGHRDGLAVLAGGADVLVVVSFLPSSLR